MSLLELTSTLKVAADLNNEAAVQIQQRRYCNALSTLTRALIKMKMGLSQNRKCVSSRSRQAADTTSTGNVALGQTSSFLPSGLQLQFASSCEQREGQASHEDSSSRRTSPDDSLLSLSSSSSSSSFTSEPTMVAIDDDWYLYYNPIIMTSSYNEAMESSPLRVEMLSYALLYNVGLCHHLTALLDHDTKTDDASVFTTTSARIVQLQKAVSFYSHAQRLMFSQYYLGLDLDVIHTLAITNNMGHAYHFLNNESGAKICFQRLLNAIMYLSQSGQEEGRQQMLTENNESHLDCFLANIMHFITLGSSCPAPAA